MRTCPFPETETLRSLLQVNPAIVSDRQTDGRTDLEIHRPTSDAPQKHYGQAPPVGSNLDRAMTIEKCYISPDV